MLLLRASSLCIARAPARSPWGRVAMDDPHYYRGAPAPYDRGGYHRDGPPDLNYGGVDASAERDDGRSASYSDEVFRLVWRGGEGQRGGR